MIFVFWRFCFRFFMLLFVKFFNDDSCILRKWSDNLEIWKIFLFTWRIMITLTCILMNVSCIDEFFVSSLSRLRIMLLYSLNCKCSIFHSDTLQDKCLYDTISKVPWFFSKDFFFVFEVSRAQLVLNCDKYSCLILCYEFYQRYLKSTRVVIKRIRSNFKSRLT